MLKLKVIIGSTRPARAADQVISWIAPEYNHSVPAVLKNAIDTVFATFAFRAKPVACVAYSGGIAGGTRAIEHLAQIAIEAEMVPLRNNVIIPFVGTAFGPDGQPLNHQTAAAAKIMLDDLAWWGTTLQQARSAGTLPPPAAMRLMAALEGAAK
jgi:NAD(P)H-dependent FMN reductase